MNTPPLIRILFCACVVAGFQTKATPIYSLPTSIVYNGSAGFYAPVSQSVVISAPQESFTAMGPDSSPLFDVSLSANQITITALRTFTIGSSSFMDFHWDFTVVPGAGVSFASASLISSSLYSIPPFTFAVVPPVDFNSATGTISVGGFIADGVGQGTVNQGGSAVIGFTIVPEPSTGVLLVSYVGISILLKRMQIRRRFSSASSV